MFDTGSIGFATAFVAGVISFLSPCVLPLVPGYLSYVAGTSLESLRDRQAPRLQALGYAVCFVLGFSAVFVAFGASATALGGLLLSWRYELGIAGRRRRAAVRAAHGGPAADPSAGARGPLPRRHRAAGSSGAFLLGLAFAFGWTPCIGPVLGVILTMSASSADLATGTACLRSIRWAWACPFLLAALFTDVLLERLRQLSRTGRQLQRVAGILLAVVGVLMITGQLEAMAYWLLETFPAPRPDRLSR